MFLTYNHPDLVTAEQMLTVKLAESREKIEKLLAEPGKTFEGFVRNYQNVFEEIEWFMTPISILNSTCNNEELQTLYPRLLALLSEFTTSVKQDLRLYNIFRDIYRQQKDHLPAEAGRLLELEIQGFELAGASLPDEKKNRVREINTSLSELQNRFSQNVLNATTAFELLINDPEDVKEIPAGDLAMAATGNQNYRFTLQGPSYMAYMTHGSNRQLREKLYRAYVTRAPENSDVLEKILSLRQEKAGLLGFDSYAALSLEIKMAENPAAVLAFLEELLIKSANQAKADLSQLSDFAQSCGVDQLASFDTAYYSYRLQEKLYAIDEEAYRPYFEKEQVTRGLFDFLQKLFRLQFVKENEAAWHEQVSVYLLYRDEKPLAKLYLDLEARDHKQGGAWMGDWRAHSRNSAGQEQLPIAYVVCNFPPSSPAQPSLLRHDDVVTFFHEMGHALHHLLSQADEPFVSGISGVEWDAVEFPSQFLENFAWEKSVLQMFARHYQSNEVLPADMIERLLLARNFQSAMAMLRQLEFALFDLHIHLAPMNASQVQQTLDQIRQRTAVLPPPAWNRFQHSFSHIFAGGYSAGYYSYKWAEVLSADAFLTFVNTGIFDRETCDRFEKEVLARGGGRSAMENFEKFMGRKPDPAALLLLSGIRQG